MLAKLNIMKNSNKTFKKQDKTFNDTGGVSDKLVKLKNDRLQANKDIEEINNSNNTTIKKKVENGKKIAYNNKLDDIIYSLRDYVKLANYPTELSAEKANKCLTRVLYKTKYNGEDIQRAALSREQKASENKYKKNDNISLKENNGIKLAKSFMVNGNIPNKWCIDIPNGSIFVNLNKGWILNGCDYIAFDGVEFKAIEMKSNLVNNKEYIKSFIGKVKKSKNNVKPICVVVNKGIYSNLAPEEKKYLMTLEEFNNFCKNSSYKVIKNLDELTAFLAYIYSETGKTLFPPKSFKLADGGKTNKKISGNPIDLVSKLNEYIEKNNLKPKIEQKQKELSQKIEHPTVQKNIQSSSIKTNFFNY